LRARRTTAGLLLVLFDRDYTIVHAKDVTAIQFEMFHFVDCTAIQHVVALNRAGFEHVIHLLLVLVL
jgi:histidinol phosphatase-like enzyme